MQLDSLANRTPPTSPITLTSALRLTPPRVRQTTLQRRGITLPLPLVLATPPKRRGFPWTNSVDATATTPSYIDRSPRPTPHRAPGASRTKGSSNSSFRSRNTARSPKKGLGSPPSSVSPRRKRTSASNTFGIGAVLGASMPSKSAFKLGLGKLSLRGLKTRLTGKNTRDALCRRANNDTAMTPLISPGSADVFGGFRASEGLNDITLLRAVRSDYDLLGRYEVDVPMPATARSEMSVDGTYEPLEAQYASYSTATRPCGDIDLNTPARMSIDGYEDPMTSDGSPMMRLRENQEKVARMRTRKLMEVFGDDAEEDIRSKCARERWAA